MRSYFTEDVLKYHKTQAPDQDHLFRLYTAWMNDPSSYGEEMGITVDKIINLQLRKFPNTPIYWRLEELPDLVAELRLLSFQKLRNIKNPTNKRIYNYLRCSIYLALKDKTRKVCKQMDREAIERALLTEEPCVEFIHPLFLNNDIQTTVANMLIKGETREQIRETLRMSRTEFSHIIDAIKETLIC